MAVLDLTETGNRRSSKVFKALSDGTRRQILLLLEDERRNVGDIVRQFDLSQPTISRHLGVLREADLIIDRRQGQHVVYSINGDVLNSRRHAHPYVLRDRIAVERNLPEICHSGFLRVPRSATGLRKREPADFRSSTTASS